MSVEKFRSSAWKGCYNTYSLLMLLCLLVIGCAQSGKIEPAAVVVNSSWENEIHTDTIFDSLSAQERQRYQPDVRLAAFWNGKSVQVYVRNTTNLMIEVEPMNFGVIIDGKSYPVRPGVAIPSFPVTKLKNQEMATGLFEFPRLGDLQGQYLYFRHAQVRASRVLIKNKITKEKPENKSSGS